MLHNCASVFMKERRFPENSLFFSALQGISYGDRFASDCLHHQSFQSVGLGLPSIPVRGGLPIIRGGVVEGAGGVATAANTDQDDACARAGLAALDTHS
jgi:uncharacterized protein GlcG (DUF336 family)